MEVKNNLNTNTRPTTQNGFNSTSYNYGEFIDLNINLLLDSWDSNVLTASFHQRYKFRSIRNKQSWVMFRKPELVYESKVIRVVSRKSSPEAAQEEEELKDLNRR